MASNAQAKLIEPESLLLQIVAFNYRVGQFEANFEVEVYDPEALRPLTADLDLRAEPSALPNRGYRQYMIMVRDDYLGLETTDKSGKLLHLSIKDGLNLLEKNYDETRLFSPEDVQFEHALFYTKFDSKLAKRIGDQGIPLDEVRMVFENDQLYYQLGSEEEHILVHPSEFRVEKIQKTLEIKGRLFPLEIHFSHWDEKLNRIPQLIRYSINGRLFKEVRLTKINFRGLGNTLRAFKRKYREDFKEAITIEEIELEKIDIEKLLAQDEELSETQPPQRKTP